MGCVCMYDVRISHKGRTEDKLNLLTAGMKFNAASQTHPQGDSAGTRAPLKRIPLHGVNPSQKLLQCSHSHSSGQPA